MQFNPTNYIQPNNYWDNIKQYIIDRNIFDISSDDNDIILKSIKESGQAILGDSYESFRKFISNYSKNQFHSFSRKNLYCLIFTLNIDNINEAQYFCKSIVHQNELSARSLEEFIILCGIKLGLPYSDINNIFITYSDKIQTMPISPSNVQYGKTTELLNFTIVDNINSIEDLYSYLNNENNITFFARTRNTSYLMLFDEIGWELWDSIEWREFFKFYTKYAPTNYLNYTDEEWDSFILDLNNDGISNEMIKDLIIYCYTGPSNACINAHLDEFYKRKSIEHKKAKKKILDQFKSNYDKLANPRCELKDYYKQRFSSFGLYINPDKPEQFLTEEEIKILSNNREFSTAFLSYKTYQNLYKRNRNVEISSGIFLLSLIQKNSSLDDEYPLDFSDPDDFIDRCNEYLYEGGFPSLNTKNNFDKLFIDTYNQTVTMYPDEDSETTKELFLHSLILNLKAVAAVLKQ